MGNDRGVTSTTETAVEFTVATIAAATNNFAEANKLDEGAFGAVYRGRLPASVGGHEVAIKVLKTERIERDAERAAEGKDGEHSAAATFKREADILGQYRHPNIVALLGHCLGEGVERPCLVCEFMDGASLDERLKRDPPLTWQERHTVASDVARGLGFLHTEASPPVIHQDIKPANIMLGAAPRGGLVAKIVDFGISRIAPDLAPSRSNTHVTTETRAGTAVYMPMEYHMMGRVSSKTDTYAFGVVLLQLLTGKPALWGDTPQTRASLVGTTVEQLKRPKRHMAQLVDARAGRWGAKAWCSMTVVARRCVATTADDRCTVADVVAELDALAGRGRGRTRSRWRR